MSRPTEHLADDNSPRRGSRRRPVKKQAVGSRGHGVLIVQCDTHKLCDDGLAMADSLAEWAKLSLADRATVDLVKATTSADLRARLDALAGPYTTLVVIAHSNEDVIRIGSDEVLDWPAFPPLVARFRPRSVVIVGCRAGSTATASQFFCRIPSVKDVYASPVNARKVMLDALHFILPILAAARRQDAPAISWLRALNFVVTDEVLFRYSREEWEEIGEEDVPMVEVFDAAVPDFVQLAREVRARFVR